MLISLFSAKINFMVKMTTPYSSPYCALSSCKILGKNNELIFHKVQKTAKRAKRAKKGAKNADFRLFLPFFHFNPFLLILNKTKKN